MNARLIRSAGFAAVLAAVLVSLAGQAQAGHAYGHDRRGWHGPPWRNERVVYVRQAWCPPPARVVYVPVVSRPVCLVPGSGLSVTLSGVVDGVAVSGGYTSGPVGYADPVSGFGVTYSSIEGDAGACGYRSAVVTRVIRPACVQDRGWRGERGHDEDDDR